MNRYRVRQKVSQKQAYSITKTLGFLCGFLGVAVMDLRLIWLLAGAAVCGVLYRDHGKKFRCPECRSKLPFFAYDHSRAETVYCPCCGADMTLTEPSKVLPAPARRSGILYVVLWMLPVLAVWGYHWYKIDVFWRRNPTLWLDFGLMWNCSLVFLACQYIPVVLQRYWGRRCPHCGGHLPGRWLFRLHMGKEQTCCTHCGGKV